MAKKSGKWGSKMVTIRDPKAAGLEQIGSGFYLLPSYNEHGLDEKASSIYFHSKWGNTKDEFVELLDEEEKQRQIQLYKFNLEVAEQK